MIGEKKCLILMTTFKGAEFVRQQLDSIINQSFFDWELIIRDDGSQDNTIEIIKSYAENDKRIKYILNESDVHGAYHNFWNLINFAYNSEKYDYYFFCDQDDIWMSNKLKDFIALAESQDSNVPLMIYSDMQVIDEKNLVINESIDSEMGIGRMSGLTEFYSSGFVWGCAAMVNASLFFAIPPIDSDNSYAEIMSHDNFYAKLSLIIGKILYLDKPTIKHRRHSGNVTSGNSFSLSPLKIIKKGLFGYRNVAKTHAVGYSQTLVAIHHMRKFGIGSPLIDEVETAIAKGGFKAVKIMKKHKVRRMQRSRTFGIYIIMFLKSYKKYMNYYKD